MPNFEYTYKNCSKEFSIYLSLTGWNSKVVLANKWINGQSRTTVKK